MMVSHEFSKKSTVLIVDDQPVNIQSLASLLKDDYHIQIATSGAKALDIATGKNKPDLILLDIQMPEMDGYEVCTRLKADERTCTIPIIFVTAKDSAEDEEKGLSLGAADYISKPYKPQIVRARVKNQTERRQAEEALREAAENQRILLDTIQTQIWYLTDDHTYGAVNEAHAVFNGLRKEDMAFRDMYDLFPEDIVAVCRKGNTEVFTTGRPIRTEERLPHASGDVRIISILKNPKHKADGSVEYVVCSAEDITDQKLAEDAIRQANRKLNLLSSITRHDVFNQLTAVQLLLDLALITSEPAKVTEYISRAQEAGNHIEATIGFTREYETFGMISGGWLFVYPIIGSAETEISLSTVTVQNQIPSDLEVYADPIIRKVFANLLENAIRHGGKISRMVISCCERDNTLIITSEDDGIGVPSDEKERIFDHGYGKNTGLGLFLSREILAITGLSIRECGVCGEGARFEIEVPAGKWRMNPRGSSEERTRHETSKQ